AVAECDSTTAASRTPWRISSYMVTASVTRQARAVVGLVLALAQLAAAGPAFADVRQTVIGTSQAGAPLTLYELGDGPQRVLVLGGQHGGPEANTVELANGLLEYFDGSPSVVPHGI